MAAGFPRVDGGGGGGGAGGTNPGVTLVYHSGALGDFITALPALELLSRTCPLALWTRRPHRELAGGAALRIAAHHDLAFPVSAHLDAGRAFVFVAAASTLPAELAARGMSVHAHSPRPTDGAQHVVDFHTAAAAAAASVAHRPGVAPRLAPLPQWRSADTAVTADARRERWVLAPGSGSVTKNWPLGRYLEVAGALRAGGASVAWLMGPAEEERGVVAALPKGECVWSGLPLTAAAALLADSAGYLGNDSGTSHLAAALGTPTVAVFGPTDPAVWAPRGRRVAVVAAPTLEQVAVDDVVEACRRVVRLPPPGGERR